MSPWKVWVNGRTKDNCSRWVYDSRSSENSQQALRAPEQGQSWNQAEKTPVHGVQTWPWVKCCAPHRLSVEASIQTDEQDSGEVWVDHWRGVCVVDPEVQKDCWCQVRGHLVPVITGLAGVSSRTCRLPAPQTDAEAATAWSSSGELSTVLCMILLIRTTTMSK